MSASAAQIKAIHSLKSAAGINPAEYRATLEGFGVRSSKDLTQGQANSLIEHMKKMPQVSSRPAAVTASGRYAPKLQALWIAAYDLGVVRNRDDKALIAFVQRQTGAEHTRFLTDPGDARSAIESLKAWIGREAKVNWPETSDPKLLVIAILEAQWLRLVQIGAVTKEREHDDPLDGLPFYVSRVIRGTSRRISALTDSTVTVEELRDAQKALGNKLRCSLKNVRKDANS